MTQKIKNQQTTSTLVSSEFAISTKLKLAKIVPLNIRYEEAPQTSTVQPTSKPVKQENVLIVRRYSFDDNGGGYLGL
jgi:hypothetical protein